MFLAALMIRVDESNEGDERAQAQMSGLLITVIVVPFLVMVWYIIKGFRSELNKDAEAIRNTTARFWSNVELPDGQGSGTPIDGEAYQTETAPTVNGRSSTSKSGSARSGLRPALQHRRNT